MKETTRTTSPATRSAPNGAAKAETLESVKKELAETKLKLATTEQQLSNLRNAIKQASDGWRVVSKLLS